MDEGNLRSMPEFPISSRLLRSVDALAVLSTIGALGLLSSPDLSPGATNALQLVTEGWGSYFVLRGLFAIRDRINQRNYRILTGEETIKRKGRQLYVFGGDGHPAVDLLFQIDLAHTVPIFNSLNPAGSLIDYLQQFKIRSLNPFFLNLDIDEDRPHGTAISTRALERIEVKEDNLIRTPKGLIFASYGFGGSLVPSMLHKPEESVPLDDQQILHKRLLLQAQQSIGPDRSVASAMVRVADSYRRVKQSSLLGLFGDLVERHRIEKGPNSLDYYPERSVIWVDAVTPVMKELLKFAEPGWGVVLNTTIPDPQLPFLDEYGLVSMNVQTEHVGDLIRNKTYITVVIEADDVSTLAALENYREEFKFDYIPLFNSHRSAEIARQWGYSRAISAAEVYTNIINGEGGIQRRLEQGMSPFEIQMLLDEKFLHQKCLDKTMAQITKD